MDTSGEREADMLADVVQVGDVVLRYVRTVQTKPADCQNISLVPNMHYVVSPLEKCQKDN